MGIALCIAGGLCVLYGLTIMMAASGTPFFAVWFGLGAVLAVAGWGIQAGWAAALPLVVRRGAQVVAVAAIAVLVATQALALGSFGSRGDDAGDDLDCIIVLGAQVREGGPSLVLRYRLDTAYDYLAEHPATRCIVSGGQGPNEPEPEGVAMARYLQDRGIPSERIIVEDASLNTTGNIENSMRFIDPANDRIGIVTNDFHVFRGVAIARKKGIEHAWGIAAPSSPWFLPNNLLRESFGIAKDFLFGNI